MFHLLHISSCMDDPYSLIEQHLFTLLLRKTYETDTIIRIKANLEKVILRTLRILLLQSLVE